VHIDGQADPAVADQSEPKFLFAHDQRLCPAHALGKARAGQSAVGSQTAAVDSFFRRK
jgi:hypothetical protein